MIVFVTWVDSETDSQTELLQLQYPSDGVVLEPAAAVAVHSAPWTSMPIQAEKK